MIIEERNEGSTDWGAHRGAVDWSDCPAHDDQEVVADCGDIGIGLARDVPVGGGRETSAVIVEEGVDGGVLVGVAGKVRGEAAASGPEESVRDAHNDLSGLLAEQRLLVDGLASADGQGFVSDKCRSSTQNPRRISRIEGAKW